MQALHRIRLRAWQGRRIEVNFWSLKWEKVSDEESDEDVFSQRLHKQDVLPFHVTDGLCFGASEIKFVSPWTCCQSARSGDRQYDADSSSGTVRWTQKVMGTFHEGALTANRES